MTEDHLKDALDELDKMAHRVARYARLIRWLARSYGENDPLFHFSDFYGHPLPANVELAATWSEVVRGRSTGQPVEAIDPEAQGLGTDPLGGAL